ncbi:MAG: single-stranded DNA-binding protein [Anaerolineales bacterium]
MYQKIIFVGNLGRDPEMRYTPSGQAVTNFSAATNRRYTDSNGQQVDETTWFRVSVWGNQAEAVNQYLQQGSRVLVDGRLRPDPETGGPRIWTRNDGTPGASFEVTARRVVFLSTRAEDQAYQAEEPESSGQSVDEDDIPF